MVELGPSGAATGLPAGIGPQTAAASTSVVMARAPTGTVTSVADAATSGTVLVANTARLGATLFNDSTVRALVKLGATASATSFTVAMAAQDYYEVPFGYTGVIDAIWDSNASGSMRVTELT